MKPTQEQAPIINDARAGTHQIMAVKARAGTGKTSTAEGATRAMPGTRFRYFVYSAKNKREAEARFGGNVKPSTAHGFAFGCRHPDDPSRFMGQVYASGSRNDQRLRSSLFGPLRDKAGSDPDFRRRIVNMRNLLGLNEIQGVMALQGVLTKYNQSSDEAIGEQHIPEIIRSIFEKRGSKPDWSVLVRLAEYTFERMRDPNGDFPVDHGLYLKLISLNPPKINTDMILFDEAQDANPAMLNIMKHQIRHGRRLMLIGDDSQRIFDFTGAVDAMAWAIKQYPQTAKYSLTNSFRFGPEIADMANRALALNGVEGGLVGLGQPGRIIPGSSQGYNNQVYTELFRTNTALMLKAVDLVVKREKVHVVGGVKDSVRLLDGMTRLFNRQPANHPELTFFSGWGELKEYGESDAGGDLRPMVQLLEKQKGNVSNIIARLERADVPEKEASVILSTAHKSKGFEWPNVVLNKDIAGAANSILNMDDGDLRGVEWPTEEVNLFYVAITRAERMLFTSDTDKVWAEARALMNQHMPDPEDRSGAGAGQAMGQS